MRVLLVGGTGFMGGRTASLMRDAGHDVAVLSRGIRPPPAGATHLAADRRDPPALGAALAGRHFDFIVDFAAFDAEDVQGLLTLPGLAPCRYVLISSGQVYLVTEGAPVPCREEDSTLPLMPEPPPGSPDHPEWAYGMGKRRAEDALCALGESHGVQGLALRLPVIQGEGDPTLRLWGWLERLLDGGPVLLPAGGTRPVRFLHADDVARALLRLAENVPPPGPAYNLAQPDLTSLRAFLERVAGVAGCRPRFVGVSWEEIEAAGIPRAALPYAGRWSSVPDPSRAAGEWGFTATRLDGYLPGVVKWHIAHRPGGSHSGYASRARELELARRIAGQAQAG